MRRWILLALPWMAAPAGAQDVRALADRCAAGDPSLGGRCLDAALAAQALIGGLGVAASLGSEVPGRASTLGHRVPSSPRVALAVRPALVRVTAPDVRGSGAAPAPGESFLLAGGEASVALGLLHGASPHPTVGGILSLDVLGTIGFLDLPRSRGFTDERAGVVGGGVRVGLLRESFTLPGVSASVLHRVGGTRTLGSLVEGDEAEVRFGLSVTSARATVGKHLMGLGLLAGTGWDRARGDVAVFVRAPLVGGASAGEGRARGFTTSRRVHFVGVSLDWLVLQFSGEAGWATGYGDPGAPRGGYDPTGATPFGSVALRLIH